MHRRSMFILVKIMHDTWFCVWNKIFDVTTMLGGLRLSVSTPIHQNLMDSVENKNLLGPLPLARSSRHSDVIDDASSPQSRNLEALSLMWRYRSHKQTLITGFVTTTCYNLWYRACRLSRFGQRVFVRANLLIFLLLLLLFSPLFSMNQ